MFARSKKDLFYALVEKYLLSHALEFIRKYPDHFGGDHKEEGNSRIKITLHLKLNFLVKD